METSQALAATAAEVNEDEEMEFDPDNVSTDSSTVRFCEQAPPRKKRRRCKAARFKGDKTGGLVEEEGIESIPANRIDRVGNFWFVEAHIGPDGKLWGLPTKERDLLCQIAPFFEDGKYLRKYVVPANNEDPSVPALRVLSFGLTNTFKAMSTRRLCSNGEIVDAHQVYITEQAAWRREMFDLFRRGVRVWFELDGENHYTTVGQLNFWKVIIEKQIIDMIIDREREIQEHAREQQRLNRKRKREAIVSGEKLRRRRQLSQAPNLQMRVWIKKTGISQGVD